VWAVAGLAFKGGQRCHCGAREEMKVRPTHTCCGCCSLLIGVEVTCLLTLLVDIWLIAICSSSEPINIFHMEVPTWLEVAAATWAMIGIPIVINAGVGALYHIETNLRLLQWYLIISFAFGVVIPLYFLISGSVCDSVVSPEVQKLGSSFACGFTDTLALTWSMIFGMIHLYIIYVVWSAAEEIAHSPFPELMNYSDALQGIFLPKPPTGPYPMNMRAVAMGGRQSHFQTMPPPSGHPTLPGGYSMKGQGPIYSSTLKQSGPVGLQQSFFPAPSVGARF